MVINRDNHKKDFVLINKRALEDPNLSFKAKGLWTYCLSRPNDWKFNIKHLSTVSKEGEASIKEAVKELEKEGYIRRTQERNKGKFTTFEWEINEIKIILPQGDFPLAVFPLAENRTLLSIDLKQGLKEEEASKRGEFAASLSIALSTFEEETKQAKKPAACLSIEDKIKKCKSIKAEDKETALAYVKSNPDKFDKSDNPLGLLITIVRAGDHLKKTRASRIKENKEWVKAEIAKTNLGEQFCIGKANVSVFMSQTAPDHVIKFDHPEFKELISYRLKQRGYDTKIPLLREYK